MKKISFIAARYKEPITLDEFKNSISEFLPKDLEIEFVIYDKFEIHYDSYKLVPNIGREAYAWFDYVIQTWENPSDYYAFIHMALPSIRPDKFQANVSLCENIQKIISKNEGFCWHGRKKTVEMSFSFKGGWVGNTEYNSPDVKKQEYIKSKHQTIKDWWEFHTKQSFPSEKSGFGMCCAKKENLQSWGLEFWKSIFNDIIEGGANGEIGHYIERAMLRIAKGNFDEKNQLHSL